MTDATATVWIVLAKDKYRDDSFGFTDRDAAYAKAWAIVREMADDRDMADDIASYVEGDDVFGAWDAVSRDGEMTIDSVEVAGPPSAAPPAPSDAPALDHDGSNVSDRHDNEDAAIVSDASRWHFMPDEDAAPDLFFATEVEACAAQQGWRIARGFHPITGDRERFATADPVNADMLAALRDALEDQEAMMRDAAHVHGSADAAQARWSALAGRIAASRAAIARAEGRA